MSFQFVSDGGGKFLFLKDKDVVTVKLLEDLGQIEATGQFAKNEKGEQQYQEAFRVLHEGREKTLVGKWRLRISLREALKTSVVEQPTIKITVNYDTEKLKSGAIVAVKKYFVEEVDANVPF